MNPVEAYKSYVALKLHFTTDYDGFKFKFRVNTPDTAFYARRDRYFFERASAKYGIHLRRFYVTQFVDDVTYIKDMLSEEGHERYLHRSGLIESAIYNLKQDLNASFTTPREFFIGNHETPPQVMSGLLDGSIHLESAAHLENTVSFTRHIAHIDNIVMAPLVMKVQKYAPFLRTDREAVKEILDAIRRR
jgi:hypothetical protein